MFQQVATAYMSHNGARNCPVHPYSVSRIHQGRTNNYAGQTYNPAGFVILGLHGWGDIEFRARSLRTPLLDQTILIPPPHRFSILHFLLVSRLRSVPSVLSANETLLQVGEPTVELALDGLSFGRLAGVHRQAVTEAFEGSVHAH